MLLLTPAARAAPAQLCAARGSPRCTCALPRAAARGAASPASASPRARRGALRWRARIAPEGQEPPPPPAADGDTAGGLPQWLLDAVTSPLVYVTVGIAVGVPVVGASDSMSTVVALSALPVVGLSILARTPVGAALQAAATAKAEAARAGVAAREAARAAARASSPYYGAARPLLPFVTPSPLPQHLDGSLCGDAGFDPLGLGGEGRMARMHELELLHARWAMLAAPGALLPEALSRAGVSLGEPVWWKVGAAKLAGDTLNWGGIDGFHIAGGQGIAVIAACQLVLMGGPEYARYVGIQSLEPVGIYLPGDVVYPGGAPFDPLGLSDDAVAFEEQRVKEVKNGRLAMLAWLGFAAQAAVTGQGPVANLAAALHLE